MSDVQVLFGRGHLLVLHFPIALAFASLALQLRRKWRNEQGADGALTFLAGLAAISGVVAALTGLQFATQDEYAGRIAEILFEHQVGGIVTAALLVLSAAAMKFRPAFALPACLLASVGVIYTGHHGGELVHGSSFLNPSSRGVEDAEPGNVDADDADEADQVAAARERHAEGPIPERPEYATHIAPIFERSCLKCHGPEKRKGGLRLDEKRFAMRGGETGEAIVPGNPAQSLLMKYITLPETDEDVMPTRGKLLAKSEIETISRWIEAGAVWP